MENTKKIIVKQRITIIILVLIIILGVFYVFYSKHHVGGYYKWFNEISPDGKYSIQVDYNINTGFLSSSTIVQFTLYNEQNKENVGAFQVLDGNEKSVPRKENYRFEWHEEYVSVILIYGNNKFNIIRVYWEDFK